MNYHDMLEIMQSLHKYVPCGIVQGDCDDEISISSEQVATASIFFLVVTKVVVSRVRGCHGIRKNYIISRDLTGTTTSCRRLASAHGNIYIYI